MKMRCVGGPSDGKQVNIKEYVDYIKLIDPRDPLVVTSLGAIRHTVYTMRRLRWQHGVDIIEEFFFLAPEGWTDFQAIKWQFEK